MIAAARKSKGLIYPRESLPETTWRTNDASHSAIMTLHRHAGIFRALHKSLTISSLY